MALAAAAGAVSKSVREILAERELLRQQKALEARQAEQLALQQQQEQRLGAGQQADQAYRTDQLARQTRLDETADAERRQEGNTRGVRQMIGQLVQREGVTPTNRRQIIGMLTEVGQMPSDDLLKDPEAERQAGLKDYEDKKKIDARYRPPTQGAQPEWVKTPTGQIVKRVPQQGDKPYDSVAERQDTSKDGPSAYALQTADRTITAIDDVLPKIGTTTAGVIGSTLSRLGYQPARDVSAELKTVAGNIAFNALQQMREASKTGGALGQVAVQELELLKSVEGALQQDQSPANLKAQLNKVRASMERFRVAGSMGGELNMGRSNGAGIKSITQIP